MTHNHIDDIELNMAEKTQSDKFKAAKKSTLVSVFVNIFYPYFKSQLVSSHIPKA